MNKEFIINYIRTMANLLEDGCQQQEVLLGAVDLIEHKSEPIQVYDESNNLEDPLDNEIEELVRLINQVDGIRTTESCFGHNKGPIKIYCVADSIADVNKFRYNYLYCNDMWKIELILSDITIDNGDWNKIEFVLKTSDKYYEFPVTQLLATNLAMTIKNVLTSDKVDKFQQILEVINSWKDNGYKDEYEKGTLWDIFALVKDEVINEEEKEG